MTKTKDQSAVKDAPLPKLAEPARPGPESGQPAFSTAARSNGVPAGARAADLLAGPQGFGGAGGRARMASAMQRSVGNARMARMIAPAPAATSGKTAGSGGPMPGPVQTALEGSFGVGLEGVQVHTDATAARAAKGMRARAFAVGNHIFLGPGEDPNDLGLMAHETAHVVQQQGAPAVQRKAHGATDDPLEAEAQRAAASALRHEQFAVREKVDRPRTQFLGVGDALNFFADKANIIPGFRMFTVVLGVNPINMAPVERSAANVLRAVVEFIPGGGLITQALDAYGVFDKVGGWVEQQIRTLSMTGAAIKAAVTQFLDSLSWSDILDLGGVWDRAKRIFTDPIDKIINFVKGLVTGILNFIRDAILMPIAKLAASTRGWDLLTAVLGKNPITGEAVPRTAETLIGGFMKLIGQEEVWENIKKSNALGRAWVWFQNALKTVIGFVQQIPATFISALKSLELADIVLLPKAFAKVAMVFGNFIGQFISWAGEAVWNLLQIIFEVVAPGAIPYLKRVGAAFRTILKNPMGFVGNLVKAGKQGLLQFVSNIGAHLKKSFIEWLTGSLPGVYIPKSFELKEIIQFVLSVLGLTWQNIRQKLVKVVGETAVKAMEVGFDIVKTLVTEGPAAAWDKIKEQVGNLKDMVIQGIMDFLIETVVKKAIMKIIGFLIPGAGFLQAIITIYDTIMVFIEKLKKIVQVAMAFVDSIVQIANGVIGAAANKVESTLAGLLTLAISFLAGFVGLGNVAEKVMEIINTKVRAPIDKALDFVITWIVNLAKKIGKFFGIGKDSDAAKTPTKGLKIEKPLSMHGTTHTLYAEVKDGKVTIQIASRLDELRSAINRAINEESKGGKRTGLIDMLNGLLSTLKSTEESIAAAIVNSDPALEARLTRDVSNIGQRLIEIGEKFGLQDLMDLGHASKYVKDGMIAEEYRGKSKFRALFYGDWNGPAEEFRETQLKGLKMKAKRPEFASHKLFGNENAFVVEDRNGQFPDKPYLDDASKPRNTPLDHVESVGQHWNEGAAGSPAGNNSVQEKREAFYNNTKNLQVLNQRENSRKKGDNYDYKVGKDFKGPGE